MPKWTYYLTVYNQLDRPFKVETKNIAWGRTEGEDVCPGNFPQTNTLYMPPQGRPLASSFT